jgi:hypothetical protein
MRRQKTIFRAEQEAMIKAIYISNGQEATVIATMIEYINDRKLYPQQDLINWIKKTDAKNRQERWAQGENTMRFRKETIE